MTTKFFKYNCCGLHNFATDQQATADKASQQHQTLDAANRQIISSFDFATDTSATTLTHLSAEGMLLVQMIKDKPLLKSPSKIPKKTFDLNTTVCCSLSFSCLPIGDDRGVVLRNKARLIVHGFNQQEGVDYTEVYALVARIEAIRLFLAYGSFKGFKVFHLDVKSAFSEWKDLDYGGCGLDRKSTSGDCQFLGNRLVSWECKKQTFVAISTCEVEYIATTSCCSQILWIQQQLRDYGLNFTGTPMMIDDTATMSITTNPVKHSKHIEI
ncbi:hypothetical protein L1987_64975 [Smallanthus sonchifolius]|uniref:Uncharacterized protein n=1 Tax=Smallanthus sonchifolius TaxID=185202 RepID=A0ACB9BT71_9ASTR|nr:hypothetical protein L1987_64975 [Smallanthus sonchifolius]